VLGVTALSAAGLTLAAACSPINTTSTWGNTGGSTSVTGSTTTGSGQGGDPDPFPTGGFGGSGVGGSISACDATADEDKDKDGFSKAQGDCNDCDPSVNPGAIEVIATADADGGVPEPADEDCDGMIDNVAPPCDDGLALADVDASHAAQALEICKVAAPADPKSWGLLGAKYVRANGTPMSPSLQTGIEEAFGPNVAPRAGKRMMALSSGHARTPNQPGACGTQTCTENVGVAPPNGFPQDVPNCPGLSNINDDVALELSLRAPSNANGYAFDFFFVSFEYPEWVCTSYNDQFIALVSPPPAQSQNGNISFDSMSNPVSVNIAFFDVCQGCPLGAAQLAGTGFDLWGDAGGTGWLTTQTPVKGGDTFSIRFAIWDTGDQALDSTTLIDDFRWLATSGTVETVTLPTGPKG
jgi:hypothetical protein